jgi:hypothetical protein
MPCWLSENVHLLHTQRLSISEVCLSFMHSMWTGRSVVTRYILNMVFLNRYKNLLYFAYCCKYDLFNSSDYKESNDNTIIGYDRTWAEVMVA